MNVVGTFCFTWTVTGSPCFDFKIELLRAQREDPLIFANCQKVEKYQQHSKKPTRSKKVVSNKVEPKIMLIKLESKVFEKNSLAAFSSLFRFLAKLSVFFY